MFNLRQGCRRKCLLFSVTTVVSLAMYILAQAPERVVSASLGVTAP